MYAMQKTVWATLCLRRGECRLSVSASLSRRAVLGGGERNVRFGYAQGESDVKIITILENPPSGN